MKLTGLVIRLIYIILYLFDFEYQLQKSFTISGCKARDIPNVEKT